MTDNEQWDDWDMGLPAQSPGDGLPLVQSEVVEDLYDESDVPAAEVLTTTEDELSEPPVHSFGNFVHLHTHSEYSSLDGLGQLPAIVNAAVADNNPAIAVTDHGTLSGAWKLDGLARQSGIKPIVGIETYLAYGSRFAKGTGDVDPDDEDNEDEDTDGGAKRQKRARKYMHLTLLAATEEGWHNLVTIANKAQDSFWSKPRVDYELLAEHPEGLIVMTGCIGGPLGYYLNRAVLSEARGERDAARALRDEARQNLDRIIDAVGIDNVFIEVMDHGIPAQLRVADELRRLSEETGVPLVATNDAHFVSPDHAQAHEAWLAVSSRKTLTDPKRFKFNGGGHHLRTEAEMRALFDGADWWQEACDNTVLIANRIADRVLPEPKIRLPHFPVPSGYANSADYLRGLVREGAFEKYGEDPNRPGRLPREVNERLKYEFEIINTLGFADYFLLVWDVITWARSQGIRVGPGRGSAAGSVVSYALGIVGVDPLRHNLLFERFLDLTRAELPDIDTDFEQGRRGEVLAYFASKWGHDQVAQLGTFGIARTKAAIKDAARVLDLTPVGNRLSAKVPSAGGKAFSFAKLDESNNLECADYQNVLRATGADGKKITDLARAFEGTTRQPGVHACGVVLSDESMTSLIPTRNNRSKDASIDAPRITEWEGPDIEAYGLVKMDFLGLRNLDVISRCMEMIEKNTGEVFEPDRLDPDNPEFPERDARVWEMLQGGKTAGVFQLDSQGMTNLCVQVAPDRIDDLNALVALFRPGPLSANMHTQYADRKNGREDVSYDYLTRDPDEQKIIASVLDTTYGVVAFQEQLMRLGEVVAGFDAGQKSFLRKAVSKKKKDMVDKSRQDWMAGGVLDHNPDGTPKVAFSKDTLEKLWRVFEGSASYLFNASHSAAYAFVAYITAYLKANWPNEYAAAVLACTDSDTKRLVTLVDMAAEGLNVLPPDVNKGQLHTSSDGTSVRLGLGEVKGVGSEAEKIIAARDENGEFSSLADMMARARPTVTAVEALIEAGACDCFGPRLGLMMIVRGSLTAKKEPLEIPLPDARWSEQEAGARQRARLGCIVGRHPLLALRDHLKNWTFKSNSYPNYGEDSGRKPKPIRALMKAADGAKAETLGILSEWTTRTYKGGTMANMVIEGSSCSIRGVAFDSALQAIRLRYGGEDPQVGDLIAVSGKVQVRVREFERIDEEGETVTETETSTEMLVWEAVPVDVDDTATISLPEPESDPLAGLDVIPEDGEAHSESFPPTQPDTPGGDLDPFDTPEPHDGGEAVPEFLDEPLTWYDEEQVFDDHIETSLVLADVIDDDLVEFVESDFGTRARAMDSTEGDEFLADFAPSTDGLESTVGRPSDASDSESSPECLTRAGDPRLPVVLMPIDELLSWQDAVILSGKLRIDELMRISTKDEFPHELAQMRGIWLVGGEVQAWDATQRASSKKIRRCAAKMSQMIVVFVSEDHFQTMCDSGEVPHLRTHLETIDAMPHESTWLPIDDDAKACIARLAEAKKG